MSDSRVAVLELLVAMYDRRGEPLSKESIVCQSAADRTRIEEYLDVFERCDLITRRTGDDRIVPTVTARELLELDLDGSDFLVLEPVDTDC